MSDDLFLGFDLSTQQLKIIVIDASLAHLKTYHVEFDKEFKSKYHINKGVVANDETGEVVTPVGVWLESLDVIFGLMKKDGFPFEKVKGVSGSCQQHGSVFWSSSAEEVLSHLDDSSSLAEQLLPTAFSWDKSPNWQDHSTGEELKLFEKKLGDGEKLARATGSTAHYRFTGLQIRKVATKNPRIYAETERISLVSSFLSSVLLGFISSIEESDACGMNLYDILNNDFNDELLELAAGVENEDKSAKEVGIKDLRSKLGHVDPITYKSLGNVSSYFVSKYGFNKDCAVYSFTGDNLATIISLPLNNNDLLISLGTSTTVLLITNNYNPSSQYHLFKHPTLPGSYMGMICYCNGALAREKVKDDLNAKYNITDGSWDKFSEVLKATTNKQFDNQLGVYFPLGEIVPNATAQFKRSKLVGDKLEDVKEFDIEQDVVSIVESQSLSCRLRAGPMLNNPVKDPEKLAGKYQDLVGQFGELTTDDKPQTFDTLTSRPHKCFYVGGGSNNIDIVNKMSSILGALDGNYKVDIPNACALGGAYKASWSYKCETANEFINYNEYLSQFEFKDFQKIEAVDQWEDYFVACGMLAKMEGELAR